MIWNWLKRRLGLMQHPPAPIVIWRTAMDKGEGYYQALMALRSHQPILAVLTELDELASQQLQQADPENKVLVSRLQGEGNGYGKILGRIAEAPLRLQELMAEVQNKKQKQPGQAPQI